MLLGMFNLILVLHCVVCVLVVAVVLLQSGKGAGFSGLMGGGGSEALFSAPSGSMFIRKLTTGLAVGFFLTCLMLTYLSAHRSSMSVTQNAWTPPPAQSESGPAAPPVESPEPVAPK